MSLKEAVLEIVTEMESDISEDDTDICGDCVPCVRGYVRALKAACKAHNDTPQIVQAQVPDFVQHRQMIESAKAEFQKNKKEDTGPRMVQIEGDEAYIEIASDMPVEAKMSIGKSIFQLREDGKLHKVES